MKTKTRRLIWAILIICSVSSFLIYLYSKPKSIFIYNIGYKIDAVQHTDKYGDFKEWWYFDGNINENLSFVLIFWIDTKENWVELALYDREKNNREVYRSDFSKNNIEIPGKKYIIKMGGNSIVEENGIYAVIFNSRNCRLQFKLIPLLRGFGNLITLPVEKISYWFWIVAVPRGKINGRLERDKERMEFDGLGYHDHNYFPRHTFNPSGWYWGRFFTKNYTAITGTSTGLQRNRRSFFCIFKNEDLIKVTTRRNLFPYVVYKKINNNQVPQEIDIKFNAGQLSILNECVARQTQWYTRFVNKIKIKIFEGRNELMEEGEGVSELVH